MTNDNNDSKLIAESLQPPRPQEPDYLLLNLQVRNSSTGKMIHNTLQVPYWTEKIVPKGGLVQDNACHGLWYYYCLAVYNWWNETYGTRYEDDPEPQHNYFNLFNSIANMYGTTPERMAKFWPNIDMQCRLDGLHRLPGEFRFDSVPEITTIEEDEEDDERGTSDIN